MIKIDCVDKLTGSELFDTTMSLKNLIIENGVVIKNTLELSNVVFNLQDLNYNNENCLLNDHLKDEEKIKFAKKEFDSRYRYKLFEISLLQKINKSKSVISYFDDDIATIQYYDKGLHQIEVAIHISSSDVENMLTMDILNILKVVENVCLQYRHDHAYVFNFTIMIGRAFVYLDKKFGE